MRTKGRYRRFLRLAVATASALLPALLVPVPAEAGPCEACTWDLYCVGGATCWLDEYCTKDKPRVYASCAVDQFGECHTAGDHCYLAEGQLRDGVDPFDLLQQDQVESACRVSEVSRLSRASSS